MVPINPHLPDGSSQHPLVPMYYRVWLTYPTPYPKTSPAQGLGCLPPSCPSLFNPAILVTWYFLLTFTLLAHHSSSSPFLLLSDVSVSGCVHLLYTINLLHHTSEQSSSPCLFLSFFLFSFTGQPQQCDKILSRELGMSRCYSVCLECAKH